MDISVLMVWYTGQLVNLDKPKGFELDIKIGNHLVSYFFCFYFYIFALHIIDNNSIKK